MAGAPYARDASAFPTRTRPRVPAVAALRAPRTFSTRPLRRVACSDWRACKPQGHQLDSFCGVCSCARRGPRAPSRVPARVSAHRRLRTRQPVPLMPEPRISGPTRRSRASQRAQAHARPALWITRTGRRGAGSEDDEVKNVGRRVLHLTLYPLHSICCDTMRSLAL
jgi:hypothetical protein